MRAAWYERTGPAAEVLRVGELLDPVPGDGEVLVRLAWSGINPGDIKKRAGWLGGAMSYPRVIPHSDGAGVIEAIGSGVPRARLGERVWVWGAQSYRPWGTAAEYVAVPQEKAVSLPGMLDLAVGACLGISARTAHRCVHADGPVTGQTVLVAGGNGNVGHAAIVFARRGGANVLTTTGLAANLDLPDAVGGVKVLDRYARNLAGQILDLTAGQGVDRIVEVAFGANIELNAQVIANGGVIATYASDADAEPKMPFWPLVFRNVVLRLVGSDDLPAAAEQAAVAEISASLEAGDLQPRIAATFALDAIADAHDLVERGAGGHVLIDLA